VPGYEGDPGISQYYLMYIPQQHSTVLLQGFRLTRDCVCASLYVSIGYVVVRDSSRLSAWLVFAWGRPMALVRSSFVSWIYPSWYLPFCSATSSDVRRGYSFVYSVGV
jgi:hypothetical protein